MISLQALGGVIPKCFMLLTLVLHTLLHTRRRLIFARHVRSLSKTLLMLLERIGLGQSSLMPPGYPGAIGNPDKPVSKRTDA
jgi:hypothetical protein